MIEHQASPRAVRLRRAPAQERAQARLARILGAAEALLVERGFEALTLAAVARSAGVNIATVYERFPHRAALLRVLAERYVAELQVIIARASEEGVGRPLTVAIDELVDAVHAFHAANPAYLAVWSGAQSHPELKSLDASDTHANAATLARLLQGRLPAGRDAEATALTLLLAVGHVLRYAASTVDPEPLIAEAKRLAAFYLDPGR